MNRNASGHYDTTAIGGETVRAFVPFPLPPEPPLDLSGNRQRLLERATLALGRLDSVSTLLPDPQLFLYAYFRLFQHTSFGKHCGIITSFPDLSGSAFACPEDVEERALLALTIDQAMRDQAPAGWKGDQAKESIVKNFLHKLINKDGPATLALFEIVKNQPGY